PQNPGGRRFWFPRRVRPALPYPQKKKNETATAPSRFPKKKEKNRTSCRSCSERSPPLYKWNPSRPDRQGALVFLLLRSGKFSLCVCSIPENGGLWQGGLGLYAVIVL